MAGRVGLVVADEAVEPRLVAGVDQAHPVEPVGQRAARALDAGDVAVHDQAVDALVEVLGKVPALQLERLGLGGILAVGRGRVGIAAVGADQPVDHRLERRRALVPVHRRDDDDGVGQRPALVDLVHPVVRLRERVVRVAAARPVAKRHCGRDAALARMDPAAVFRGDEAQVEVVDLDPVFRQHFGDEPSEPERLRDLARAGAVVARRPADDERARLGLRVGPGRLREVDARLGVEPVD